MPRQHWVEVIPHIRQAVERQLQTPLQSVVSVGGGDINDAYRAELADGRSVFVKCNGHAPEGMFEAEAHGLEWLRAARAISVPRVLGHGVQFLLLEWIESARQTREFDESFGQQLAALHRFGADVFGLERDNFIGRLPQHNRPCKRFADLLSGQRWMVQLEIAREAGHFDASFAQRFERLVERLDELLGQDEPPARLHGDLWSGNTLVGPDGLPWLIDPAVYGGHREIDLAMMRLFGGFSARVFDAYNEAYPLQPGHEGRLPLMQLYPLMVHVNLFGGNYAAAVRRVVNGYVG